MLLIFNCLAAYLDQNLACFSLELEVVSPPVHRSLRRLLRDAGRDLFVHGKSVTVERRSQATVVSSNLSRTSKRHSGNDNNNDYKIGDLNI